MANLSLEKQVNKFKAGLAQKLKEAGLILEGEMHNLVAIDTGRLNKSITSGPVVDRGNILSVDVGSEGVPYAIFVDQGVNGKTYNYHRRSGLSRPVVYSGLGQKYMERALIATEDRIRAKLRETRVQ